MSYISVILPLYNNAGSFDELIDRLIGALSKITPDFKIICVDDRGPEPIWPLIQKRSNQDPRVEGIRLSRNFGQHAAITAGLSHADSDWLVVMDGDLQDRPEDIVPLHKHAKENNSDIVIAMRENSGLAWYRNLGSRGFNFIVRRFSGLPLSHRYGNYRIFSKKVLGAFLSYDEQMRLFPAIMAQLGYDPQYLELPRDKRKVGTSSYNISRLLSLAYSIIINYSTKPLIYVARLGVAISIASVGFALFLVTRYLMNGSEVPGWTSLMVLVSFFSGVQISLTSLVGLYVGQAFQETKKRPHFIVKETTMLSGTE